MTPFLSSIARGSEVISWCLRRDSFFKEIVKFGNFGVRELLGTKFFCFDFLLIRSRTSLTGLNDGHDFMSWRRSPLNSMSTTNRGPATSPFGITVLHPTT